jgi:serine/threonine protein kinase
MIARPEVHPSDSDLQGFTQGKLDDSAARSLIDHLEECPDCRKRAAELPDCTLNARIGDSKASGPAVVRPAAPPIALPKPEPARRPPEGVPLELVAQTGYEVLSELGRGGMGVVYLARNLLMDRLEVLKVMSQTLVGRRDAVERFVQEIRSTARLNHPNVATAYTTLMLGDLLVLAMEYVEGEDLGKVVKAKGRLPVPFACFCVREAALGLQRGHELGLVHRDIKPGNLILSRQVKRAAVKIVDFGLAKARAEAPVDHGLTPTNQMMGTLGYTAPEQLRDARSADTRADIYSLGCTLYFLLAGGAPFKGNSAYEVFLAQEAAEVEPLQKLRPDVSEALAAVVAKMMAKDPAERYAEPAEVARALRPFLKAGVEEEAAAADTSSMDVGDVAAGVPIDPASRDSAAWRVLASQPPEMTVAPSRLAARDRTPHPAASARPPKRADGGTWPFALLIGAALLTGAAIPAASYFFGRKPEGETVVVINVPRDADVVIEGESPQRSREGTVVTLRGVHPGTHRVSVTRNGQPIWWRDVVIAAHSEPVRLVVDLPQTLPLGVGQWPGSEVVSPRPPIPGTGSGTLGGDRPPKVPPVNRPPPPPPPDPPLEPFRGPRPLRKL